MISMLRGKVHALSGSILTIDVNGVGYEVSCSVGCRERLVLDSEATIVIHTDVKEDSIRLFGFADELEKQVFLLLTKVKGVGAKTASEIISKIDKRKLLRLIGAGALEELQAVKGIGRKTAERIIVELRDKVGGYILEKQTLAGMVETIEEPNADAVLALQALGFGRVEAESAVNQVRSKGLDIADTGELVKEALRYI